MRASTIVYGGPAERGLTSRWGFLRKENHRTPSPSRTRRPSRSSSSASAVARAPDRLDLRAGERQLRRRADEVLARDDRVHRIEDRPLEHLPEEHLGVRDHVLVQGIGERDHHDERVAVLPADAPDPLPGRGHRAGIADEHAHVEPADVDPELEGAGGEDGEEVSLEQARLDLAPLFGKVPRAVGREAAPQARRLLDDPRVEQLGDPAGLGEGDRPETVPGGLRDDADRHGVRRDRHRVEEHHLAPHSGGPRAIHHLEVLADEHAGELSGVPDGRGSGQEPRLRPRGGAQP